MPRVNRGGIIRGVSGDFRVFYIIGRPELQGLNTREMEFDHVEGSAEDIAWMNKQDHQEQIESEIQPFNDRIVEITAQLAKLRRT